MSLKVIKYVERSYFGKPAWVVEYGGKQYIDSGCVHVEINNNNIEKLKSRFDDVEKYIKELLNSTDVKDTSHIKNWSLFMRGAEYFNEPLNIDTSGGVNFASFLEGCRSFNQPLNINTKNGTCFKWFMRGCNRFNSAINIDIANRENTVAVVNYSYGERNTDEKYATVGSKETEYLFAGCSKLKNKNITIKKD